MSAQSNNSATGAYTLSATTLTDTAAPLLTNRTPVDESSNIAVGSNIVLSFNETVRAGSGYLFLTDLTTGTAQAIAVTDTNQVTFSGNTVTFNPSTDLAASHRFEVTLASSVIKDTAGNSYAGLTAGGLNFNTAAAGTDTIAGTTATSAALSIGATAFNTIDTATDQDWWRVTLNAGSSYAFRLDKNAGSILDPYLRLLDSSGRQLLVDNEGGGNHNALLTYTATTSGTYYLSAQSYAGASASAGAYALSSANLADTVAPTLTGRTPVDESVNVAVGANIVLVFSEAVRAGSGNIVLTNQNTGTVRTIAITDTSQVGIAGNSITINPASDLTAGGRYDVTLASGVVKDMAGNNYAGLFSGGLNFNTAATPDTIVGSGMTTAVLRVDGAVGNSEVNTSGDQDWWQVSLTAGSAYTFRLDKTADSGLDAYLRLFDRSGNFMASDDESGGNHNALLVYTPTISGIFYVSAQGYAASTGAYALTATRSADVMAPLLTSKSPADESANIALGSNIVLTFNETVRAGSGSILINNLTTGAVRAITVTDTSQVSFSGTSVTVNPDSDLAGGSRFAVTMAAGVVKDTAGNSYAGLDTYSLNFTTASAADTILSTTATTAVLQVDGPAGTSNIDIASDQDWWKVTLSAGNAYTFRLDKTGDSTLDPYLSLLDSAGVELVSNNNIGYSDSYSYNDNALIVYTPAAGGTYYLAAQSSYGYSAGAYALTATSSGDVVAPRLTAVSPVNGTINIALDSNLVLTFNETVRAGSGIINITDSSTGSVRAIIVTDTSQVTFSGNTMTINPNSDLAGGGSFQVTMGAGVVKDTAGNSYAGLVASTFNFNTAGAADTILSTVATTAVLQVDGPAVTSSIDIAADQDWWQVSLSAGTAYTFHLDKTANSPLDPYLRLLDSTGTELAFNNDSGGNYNAQIVYSPATTGTYYLSAQSNYSYYSYYSDYYSGAYTLTAISSGDVVAPRLTQVSPADETINIALDSNLVLNFSETVRAGSGIINLTDLTTGAIRAIAVTDTSQVSFSGNSMTINPSSDLAGGTRFEVTMGVGVVKDTAGNNYAGLSGYTFNFTTAAAADTVLSTTASTATIVVNGAAQTSSVDMALDQDWWQVSLDAGNAYSFRLNKASNSTLDAYLRLLDSTGNVLAYNDDGGGNNNALITYAPASSGTYYLSAQGSYSSTGAYALTAARAGASGVAQASDAPVDATDLQLATLTGLRTVAANDFAGAGFA